eukprot:4676609-Pyramimonas_sp.AAC.1
METSTARKALSSSVRSVSLKEAMAVSLRRMSDSIASTRRSASVAAGSERVGGSRPRLPGSRAFSSALEGG